VAKTDKRIHSVTRRASENKALSTLRTRLTVRLLEYLYPFRGLTHEPYTREISEKWIYAFQAAATLIAEIYAAPSGWLRMIRPGTEDDVSKESNRISHRDGDGYFAIPDEKEDYFFFLSPIQLSQGAISGLQDACKTQDNSRQSHQAHLLAGEVLPVRVDDEEYYYYPQSGLLDIEKVVTHHTYKKRDPDKIYVALIPDPYAWAEDIQFMGHLPSLGLLDEFENKNRCQVEVALGFQWILQSDPKDTLDIRNDLAEPNSWWNCAKEPHSKPPEFRLETHHPHDSRRCLSRIAKVDPSDWQAAPRNASDVVDLRLKMHALQRKPLLDLAASFATEIAEWMDGPRHRLVNQAAVDMGGDSLAISIFHVGFVTTRLDATDPGKKWLLSSYENNKDKFVEAFFSSIEKPDNLEKKWYKPVKTGVKATLWLVKNFIGVINVVHGHRFEKVVKDIFCKQVFGLHWTSLNPDKVPKLWGKPILKRIPKGILVPEKGALATAAEKFEKYKLSEWFEGVGLAFEVVDVCLTLHTAMSEEATAAEKWKAGLETTGVAIKVVKFCVESEEGALAKAAGRRLGNAGSVVSIITGFIEFDVAVKAGLKSYYLDGNYSVAALQGVAALTVGGGIIVGALGLMAGEAATPVIGWIAFALTAVGLGVGWLVSKLTRNNWEEIASYSYLGKYYVEDDGRPFYKDYFSGWSTGFWKNCRAQQRTLIALMSGFRVRGKNGKAIFGEVDVYPRFVQAETRFVIIWQLAYRQLLADNWVYIEVKIEAEFTVADFKLSSKCTPDYFSAKIEHSVTAREDGIVESFTLRPRVAGKESWIPEKTLVLIQCQPDGGIGPEVPMDTEYEVEDGPAKRTYYNFVHALVKVSSDSIEASTDIAE
jgi:hypothetical protein